MSDQERDTKTGTSRRKFLAAAGASAALLPVLSATPAEAGKKKSSKPDVIVIGGGFCGVTACRELAGKGLNVLLLEARNRLGGRTFTTTFNGKPTDLGGTWVHWSQPHVWAELLRYNLPIGETPGAVAEHFIYIDRQGQRHETTASEVWPELDAAFKTYFAESRQVFERPFNPFDNDRYKAIDGINAQEKLQSFKFDARTDAIVDAVLSTYGSCPLDQAAWVELMRWYALSGHDLTNMNDATARYHIRGGTKALLTAIIDDAKPEIRLSTPVQTVRHKGDQVEVVTEDGEVLHASAVIMAVPLNVLKDIAFEPALDAAKLAASNETHAGSGTKLHILLKGEYPVLSAMAPGNRPLNWLLTEKVGGGTTHLIGFGPSMDYLDVQDSAAVLAEVRAFLPDAEVIESVGYQWTLDPFAQGTWCVLRPNQYDKYLAALQADNGRLIFASADWANGWRGFIDGAIEQGMLAGRQAIALLTEKS